MATKTHDRADLRALRRKLDDIRGSEDPTSLLFVRAMEKFLTAASYPDLALMQSYLAEAEEALGGMVADSIELLAARSAASRNLIQELIDQLEGQVIEPDEEFDDLGHSVTSVVSTALNNLCGFRDGQLAVVRRYEIEVPNAAKLDELVADWEAVKADLVDGWPWSTVPVPLPPVDREMVARSRAAFRAGEPGEEIGALIERLRSELTPPGKGG